MELFTVQVGKWRLARDRGIVFIDTTVKTASQTKDFIFAPTWDMVMGHKQGTVSDDEYRQRYFDMLVQSWLRERPRWETLVRSDEQVAVACFCPAGHFCHRYLLKDFLQQLCKQLEVPFTYYGELE